MTSPHYIPTAPAAPSQLYPYHLQHFVCRVLRVTPFKYYTDLLVSCLVAERPYHQLPNFTVGGKSPHRSSQCGSETLVQP